MIYMKIDQIMLGQMVGDEAVGIYSAAARISEVWYFIPTVIVASTFPAILEARKNSERQYYQRLQQLYDLMVLISFAIALPMTFLSTLLVTALFGQEFSSAGPVLAIHIWASVFVFLGVASSRWFVAESRQMLSFQRTALGAAANIILNLLLIPTQGPAGAAIATVASYAVAALFADLLQQETRSMFQMKIRALSLASMHKK
jgi:PST family polysaccharide transporter